MVSVNIRIVLCDKLPYAYNSAFNRNIQIKKLMFWPGIGFRQHSSPTRKIGTPAIFCTLSLCNLIIFLNG